ncbi:hypothetical protein Bbelb_395990, partial [Branchiostoma belcheri]
MIEEVLFCEERREGRVSCQQPSRSDRPWAGGEMARSLPATLHLSSGREVPVIYDVPCHVHFVPFPRGSNLPLPTNFSINVVGNQQRQVRPSRQEQHILTSTRNPEKGIEGRGHRGQALRISNGDSLTAENGPALQTARDLSYTIERRRTLRVGTENSRLISARVRVESLENVALPVRNKPHVPDRAESEQMALGEGDTRAQPRHNRAPTAATTNETPSLTHRNRLQ